MNLILVGIIIFILNIPFGYWRANTKKLSFQWFLAVHIPVPFVIALRIVSDIGWRFITYPILVGAFFLGQFIGGKLHNLFAKKMQDKNSSCICVDFYKILTQ
ncbi:MAG: hypothetical protein U9Q83_09220 [Bacteroidota bacterium]|nr:hypothetical protein [Bacteroidota bacterium]